MADQRRKVAEALVLECNRLRLAGDEMLASEIDYRAAKNSNRPDWKKAASERRNDARKAWRRLVVESAGAANAGRSLPVENQRPHGQGVRSGAGKARRDKARERLLAALESDYREARLSDVFYDAGNDEEEFPDGEGGTTTDIYGFDCDDVAAVLLPVLVGALQMNRAVSTCPREGQRGSLWGWRLWSAQKVIRVAQRAFREAGRSTPWMAHVHVAVASLTCREGVCPGCTNRVRCEKGRWVHG